MEFEELKKKWKEMPVEEAQVLNMQAWALNLEAREIIGVHKSKSQLSGVMMHRIFEVFILLPFTAFWIINAFKSSDEFVVCASFAIIALFSLATLISCIQQIVIITKIKFSDNVTDMQEKIARLTTYFVEYLRISILFIPFYMVYLVAGMWLIAEIDISKYVFFEEHMLYHYLNMAVLILIATWLYFKISYKNINKRWVRLIIESVGGKSASKSMEFLKEIEEFKST